MPATASVTASGLDEQLSSTPGTYVEGWLNCAAGTADLILREAGFDDRMLLRGVQDLHSFRFVTRGSAAVLELRKSEDAQAQLCITKQIAPSEQSTEPTGEICDAPISPRLMQVAQGQLTMAAFWQQVARDGSPMIEPDLNGSQDHRLVTFLWRGAKCNARLIGGPAPDHVWMQRLADSDIWFASFRVPNDLRLSYRIAPDVPYINASPRENRMALLAVAQVDPFNKTPFHRSVSDPFAQWSLFDLTSQSKPLKQLLGPVTRDVTEHRIKDSELASGRRIWIHRPTGFVPGAPGNVLQILFDGAVYLNDLDLPSRLEAAAADQTVPQVATVFVDSVSPALRSENLTCSDRFTRFLINRILPFACEKLGQDFAAQQVVVSGSSFGGLAAAYTALTQPQAVGNFISLSGSFWWAPSGWTSAAPYLASLPGRTGLRAVLTAGSYECARHEGDTGILESTQMFANHLRAQGVAAEMRTYSGGHDYAIWGPALIDALATLFGHDPNHHLNSNSRGQS